jgi:hypothetical protein
LSVQQFDSCCIITFTVLEEVRQLADATHHYSQPEASCSVELIYLYKAQVSLPGCLAACLPAFSLLCASATAVPSSTKHSIRPSSSHCPFSLHATTTRVTTTTQIVLEALQQHTQTSSTRVIRTQILLHHNRQHKSYSSHNHNRHIDKSNSSPQKYTEIHCIASADS